MSASEFLRAQAADLRARAAAFEALADELDGAQRARPSIETPYEKDEWIDTGKARRIAKVTHSTIIRWCRKYEIGYQLDSKQWRVNRSALMVFLAGRKDARNVENDDGDGIQMTTALVHDRRERECT